MSTESVLGWVHGPSVERGRGLSPEIIDCESLTVYHLFRQTGQTWSAARPGSANPHGPQPTLHARPQAREAGRRQVGVSAQSVSQSAISRSRPALTPPPVRSPAPPLPV